MKNSETQFDKAVKSLGEQALSARRKKMMLESIYAISSVDRKGIVSPFWPDISLFKRHGMVLATMLFLVFTGGTSYAAMQSLPGEPLYAVKTKWLEPMRSNLIFNEEAKNHYNVSLLQKRVGELKKLQKQGKATPTSVLINFEAAVHTVKDLEGQEIEDVDSMPSEVVDSVRKYNSAIIDFGLELDSSIIKNDKKINATTSIEINIEPPSVKEEEKQKDQEARPKEDNTVKKIKDILPPIPEAAKPVGETIIDLGGQVEQKILEPMPMIEVITQPVPGIVNGIDL